MITATEWRYWTRGHINDEREFRIPRQSGTGFDWLKEHWVGVDEYAAVFSKQQIERGSYDTILMDVDAHVEGENWQQKAGQVLAKCEVKPTRVYTTGRGCHLYWDLEHPIEGTGRYKQVVGALVKKWGIEKLVDMRVAGDVRRMARVPMSKNSHNGYCVRIPIEALDVPVVGEPETLAYEEPRTVNIVIGESKDAERQFAPTSGAKHVFEEASYPPCIRIAIKTMMLTGELDHTERLHLFSFLVQNAEKQKGYNLLKNHAGDFKPDVSEYQLGYIEKMNLNPYKCSRVPNTICPYVEKRNCSYWPSIGLHRRIILGEQGAGNGP